METLNKKAYLRKETEKIPKSPSLSCSCLPLLSCPPPLLTQQLCPIHSKPKEASPNEHASLTLSPTLRSSLISLFLFDQTTPPYPLPWVNTKDSKDYMYVCVYCWYKTILIFLHTHIFYIFCELFSVNLVFYFVYCDSDYMIFWLYDFFSCSSNYKLHS